MKLLLSFSLSVCLLAGCYSEGSMRTRYSGINSIRLKEENGIGVKLAKSIVRVPIGVMTLGYLESRYSMERKMESFIGKSEGDLQMRLGPPETKIYDPVHGDYVLCYTNTISIMGSGFYSSSYNGNFTKKGYSSTYNSIYTPPTETTSITRRNFRVSKDGIVTDYNWSVYAY